MSDKIEALRELAGKATPGPWHAVQDSVIGSGGNYNLQIADAYNGHMTDGEVEANAAYIAAASPDVILSLLSELDRLRSSNEAMRKTLEEAREVLSARASTSYCRSLDKFSETLCLGWEAKVKSGSYGLCEHEAHAEANRLMGRHIAFAEAAKLVATTLHEGSQS